MIRGPTRPVPRPLPCCVAGRTCDFVRDGPSPHYPRQGGQHNPLNPISSAHSQFTPPRLTEGPIRCDTTSVSSRLNYLPPPLTAAPAEIARPKIARER